MKPTFVEKILDNESKAVTLKPGALKIGDYCANGIMIALEGGSITVTGKVSSDTTARQVCAVSDADETIATGSISTVGNYLLDTDAYEEIIVTGVSATAYVKYLF